MRRRVLDGTIYDTLDHAFHDERSDNGEYIPLRKRRPCVRYNLSALVVQDSVSLLFGESHFPAVDLESEADRDALAALIKGTRLPQILAEAAIIGSVGSVAVLMQVLEGQLFFSAMETGFLTPEWRAEAPDTLLRVVEKYKVLGSDLRGRGYFVPDDQVHDTFWFQREWNDAAEIRFVPWRMQDERSDKPHIPEPDKERSVKHGLGFVPLVWIRNLPGGDGVDGACTFGAAVETSIEIDYQLSQAGRGLKYSSDPTLVIKEPAIGEGGSIVKGAGNALVVSEKGDAKLLEIGGTAAAAVIEYVRALREMALESIHGNRSNADRVSAAQSGRAQELLHQPLIWLADNLRTSYGENGVLPLIKMAVAAAKKMAIKIDGETIRFVGSDKPTLRWGPWFPRTAHDRQAEASALATMQGAGHVSRETAVKVLAATLDVEDADAELARIKKDQAEADARLAAQAAQTKATETIEP